MKKKALVMGVVIIAALAAGCAKKESWAQNPNSIYNKDKVRFEDYPANFPIAYLGMIKGSLFTVRDLFGADAPFAVKFMNTDTPCTVTVEETYYDDVDIIGFGAKLLLTLEDPEGKSVDALRLEVSFRAGYDDKTSLIHYVKLTDLRTGRAVEKNPTERELMARGRAVGETAGIFAGAMDAFWDLSAFSKEAPEELLGTWVRTGAASKRAFDSTLIITADQLQWKYSDGRSAMAAITGSRAVANDSGMSENKAVKKAAAEYPSGWSLNNTTTEAEGDVPWEVGGTWANRFFLNAGKDKLTQGGGDLTDIWVKQ
ncbi:MAG: hypothetical protein LBJ31_05370 [Treponema sp.]|jgi:hypothetical protein|nr:hypothetical protein [Treponema sp.]